jgi:hypothetical protein
MNPERPSFLFSRSCPDDAQEYEGAVMKARKVLLVLVLAALLVVLVAGSAFAASLPKVTGGGQAYVDPGVVSFFNYNARAVDEQGNARGWVLIEHPWVGVDLRIQVLYLAVSDNIAWIGGVITQGTPAEWVGQELILAVQDNGEGSKALTPDLVTPGYFTDAANALLMPEPEDIPVWEVLHGNVQLH